MKKSDQGTNFQNFNTGGKKMDEKLLAFVIVWIFAPRGSNHAQLSKDDMMYNYVFKNDIQLHSRDMIYELKAKIFYV